MKSGLITGITAVLIALLAASGCKVKEETPPPPAELIAITLRPSAPSIAPGTALQLEAIGNYSNNGTANLTNSVTWESADPAVAAVSGTGLVTAANTGSTASTTISAKSGAVSGSTLLTVSPLASLAVTPADQTIAGGTSLQLGAVGTLENSITQNLTSFVTWTSSNTAIAAVSGTGLASTVPAAVGQTTITASLGTVSGATGLTSAAVASIAVTPPTARIALGTTRQFTATGTLTGGPTQDLTTFAAWTSSSPTVATVGNTAGSFGLAESKGTGTTNILASFDTVTSAPPATLTVTPATLSSISIAPTTTSVAAGNRLQYSATGSFSDGTLQNVTAEATWTSSNTLVATVSNATGTRGLVSTLAQGTTTITAALSGVTSDRATLTVTAPALVSIAISPPNPVISLSFSVVQQFTALGLISDGTTTNLTSSATWQSSIPTVALISDVGLSKGFANLGSAGTTTISATFGTITGSTVLTVTF
jgi:Big-like domain-containing protein